MPSFDDLLSSPSNAAAAAVDFADPSSSTCTTNGFHGVASALREESPVSLRTSAMFFRSVEVVFCSLGCPCTELIRDDIEERLLRLPGIERVEIEEVFEPWSRTDITPRGLAQLREVGVA